MKSIVWLLVVGGIAQLVAQPKDKQVVSQVPDYSNLKYWAAHPLKHDPSDSIPDYDESPEKEKLVDVFFIHPTSYTENIDKANWNADIDDKAVNKQTDDLSILYQASVFNASAKIYAPRYRQAHMKAFLKMLNPNSQKALDLAYEDVKAAFEYYLKHHNEDRPIIIAAHSQGTIHATRLLQEYFDKKPLLSKLVCSYLVGWKVAKNDFDQIPVCQDSSSVMCFVTWRTHVHGTASIDIKIEKGNGVCVNPITWKTDTVTSSFAQHKGTLNQYFDDIEPNSVTAKVSDKYPILWVKTISDEYDFSVKNLHILDYQLFYEDIRRNVEARVRSYIKK